ncbi:MAG TPA: hypothetical protein VGG10_18980 [Rhizomicrobium sp.]|jgi:hypothetical protein
MTHTDNPMTTEVYGSSAFYGAIVAGAAFLLVATVSSFGPSSTVAPQQLAKAPISTIETVVVTAGRST